MPRDGEVIKVGAKEKRWNARTGLWEATDTPGTSVGAAPKGIDTKAEASKFKAANQAKAIEGREVSPLAAAAKAAEEKRKKKSAFSETGTRE